MVGGGRGGLPYMEVAPGTFLKIYYCLPPTSSAPLSVSSFDIHYEPFYLSLSSLHTCMFCFDTFLFRSARTSCTTPGWPVCLSAMKIWIPCIQAYKYASWIIRRLIKPTQWPHGIPQMPPWPPGTPKQVSWPHWTLKFTSTALQIIRRPIKCCCWSYRTSYPSPLTPWANSCISAI